MQRISESSLESMERNSLRNHQLRRIYLVATRIDSRIKSHPACVRGFSIHVESLGGYISAAWSTVLTSVKIKLYIFGTVATLNASPLIPKLLKFRKTLAYVHGDSLQDPHTPYKLMVPRSCHVVSAWLVSEPEYYMFRLSIMESRPSHHVYISSTLPPRY